MAYKKLDKEKVSEMRSMYLADNSLSVRDLSEAYDIPKTTVYRLIHMSDEEFESYKDKKSTGKRLVEKRMSEARARAEECPVCHAPITNQGARFCWKCGRDVRTDEMKAAEGLVSILGAHYPGFSDEHADAIRSAIKLLGINIDRRG